MTLPNLLNLTDKKMPSQMLMNLVRKYPFDFAIWREEYKFWLHLSESVTQLLFCSLTLSFLISKRQITFPLHRKVMRIISTANIVGANCVPGAVLCPFLLLAH